ncbi:MAG: class I SAM-dependent methyltransferase [Euryarchaeota archaeon]|nr:class I SAM-dependent methyltransferase [Euryarchaeota archaeon]MDE1837300.1 class I SAM-dependent methyltransferase [Euryarchaeota archaeon]MDE1879828.1 class I SAM-dependent methyltransferase [Euryarchaeota archaeon]MDE2045269.1 class I SAM-dependent methyltransferase [Thermoplasmata archaeon]
MSELKTEARQFYRLQGDAWDRIGEDFPRWVLTNVPEVPSPSDLLDFFASRLAGPRVLAAGCGPMPRDVDYLVRKGCRVVGIDLVPESVHKAHARSASSSDFAAVDLESSLPFKDGSFDAVLCVAVIQHIARRTFLTVVLPEFERVLGDDGVLLLAFKRGNGVQKVEDRKLGLERTFQLFDPREVLEAALKTDLHPLPFGHGQAQWLEFADEREIPHAVLMLQPRRPMSLEGWLSLLEAPA